MLQPPKNEYITCTQKVNWLEAGNKNDERCCVGWSERSNFQHSKCTGGANIGQIGEF